MQIIEKKSHDNLLSEKDSFSFHFTVNCAESCFRGMCSTWKLYSMQSLNSILFKSACTSSDNYKWFLLQSQWFFHTQYCESTWALNNLSRLTTCTFVIICLKRQQFRIWKYISSIHVIQNSWEECVLYKSLRINLYSYENHDIKDFSQLKQSGL